MSQPTADLIRGVPLFADLDDKTTDRLAGEFIERHFDEGAAIATEGSDGLNFFIVASGEAAVSIQGQQVGTLGPGTSFGEGSGDATSSGSVNAGVAAGGGLSSVTIMMIRAPRLYLHSPRPVLQRSPRSGG